MLITFACAQNFGNGMKESLHSFEQIEKCKIREQSFDFMVSRQYGT
jgi:hypothetical protein